MPIVVSKLISAAMLQDFLIGKDALPLAAGIVTFYQDANHVLLKNVYEQTGVPGSYSYVALPNPMVLSAAGTMQDVNGNDIIPFYYPWDETDSNIAQPYFITVYNANGQLQFTRSNFPFNPNGGSGPIVNSTPTLENFIINNRFWRNIGTLNSGAMAATDANVMTWTTQYNSTGTQYAVTLCPDQHDDFSMPDFNYVKNVLGSATETINFNVFAKQIAPVLKNDVQPEFYINHNCVSDTSGAVKFYQFPISLHLATLASQPFTFTIQGQSVSGNPTITVSIYTFAGTGVASAPPTMLGTLTLGTGWNKFTLTGTFPPNLGVTLGSDGTGGNDDAYYLQIGIPTGLATNLNFTLPSIYLSSPVQVPTNSFATYDQIDSVIASPRTGDVKISMNTFYPYGWVPLNDGTLAHPGSITPPTNLAISYQGLDAWALYNMLWTRFSPYSVNGAELLQIYTSAGAPTTFGASAYADWNALKQIQLNQMMGRVILGTVPVTALTPKFKGVVTASNSGGNLLFTAANNVNFFKGMTIYFTNTGGALPTGIAANTIYYVGSFNGTTGFLVSTTFDNAMAGVYVAFTNAGSGTTNVISAWAGTIEGEYAHTQLETELALHHHSGLFVTSGGGAATPGTTQAFTATPTNTGDTGSSTPFNVTQPGIFFNMFMKL